MRWWPCPGRSETGGILNVEKSVINLVFDKQYWIQSIKKWPLLVSFYIPFKVYNRSVYCRRVATIAIPWPERILKGVLAASENSVRNIFFRKGPRSGLNLVERLSDPPIFVSLSHNRAALLGIYRLIARGAMMAMAWPEWNWGDLKCWELSNKYGFFKQTHLTA